ncbi:MAG: hypothetical protein NTY48_04900 [Candidatus Diapherotrites archaeon]|nr:hypothetical protein [Candidatus Diapherotrites archaeon]
MIKKNTKIVFEDGNGPIDGVLEGGIPLTKGETINFNVDGKVYVYIVKEKTIDCILKGKDQLINIVYVLGKK